MNDLSYIAWLKINHPTEVCSNTAAKSSSSLASSEPSKTSQDSVDCGSGKLKLSSNDALSQLLVLPCAVPKSKNKCKPALNAKAVCITDDSVLEDLKRKEDKKIEAKKEKEEKRIERETKKRMKQLEKERKKAIREEKKIKKKCAVNGGKKTRSRRNSAQEGMDDLLAALCLSSS